MCVCTVCVCMLCVCVCVCVLFFQETIPVCIHSLLFCTVYCTLKPLGFIYVGKVTLFQACFHRDANLNVILYLQRTSNLGTMSLGGSLY